MTLHGIIIINGYLNIVNTLRGAIPPLHVCMHAVGVVIGSSLRMRGLGPYASQFRASWAGVITATSLQADLSVIQSYLLVTCLLPTMPYT